MQFCERHNREVNQAARVFGDNLRVVFCFFCQASLPLSAFYSLSYMLTGLVGAPGFFFCGQRIDFMYPRLQTRTAHEDQDFVSVTCYL